MSGFPGEERRIAVAVWGRSDVGRVRSENQDAFLVAAIPERGDDGFLLGPDSPELGSGREARFEVGERGALLLVADGMGGAAGGAVASRLGTSVIVETLMDRWSAERLRTPPRFAALMREAVREGNRRIHERARERPDLRGMGTTTTLAGVLDGFVYVAQVGDSRAYLVRDGRTVRLTRDQSVVQELIDSGAMTPEEAERSAQRSVLLQALGTEPDVDVALTYHPLRRGDRLVLCSDGLTGQVSDGEIGTAVASADTPGDAVDGLVDLANERGGPDNVTVVVARVEGDALADAAPGEQAVRRPFDPDAE